MFERGASAIQIYSALIFQGPALIAAINKAVLKEMNRLGVSTFDEFRSAIRRKSTV